MGAEEAWAYELEQERYRLACEAINRCAAAGAKTEDLKTLARECGLDIKHTVLGEIK
jgi:hypothetical protein